MDYWKTVRALDEAAMESSPTETKPDVSRKQGKQGRDADSSEYITKLQGELEELRTILRFSEEERTVLRDKEKSDAMLISGLRKELMYKARQLKDMYTENSRLKETLAHESQYQKGVEANNPAQYGMYDSMMFPRDSDSE